MATEPTVTFRHMGGSEALEADIRKRFARLEALASSIVSARVLVLPAERHHRAGNRIHVRIEIGVPGEDIVVDHAPSPRPSVRATGATTVHKQDEREPDHRHARVAIRDAFEAARRRLHDRTNIRRGHVKAHVTSSPARRTRS